jgi:hypothetical protein
MNPKMAVTGISKAIKSAPIAAVLAFLAAILCGEGFLAEAQSGDAETTQDVPQAAPILRAKNATFKRGQLRELVVELESAGEVNAVTFTLRFNPSILRLTQVEPITNAIVKGGGLSADDSVLFNPSTEGAGFITGGVAAYPGRRFTGGVIELVKFRFTPVTGAALGATQVNITEAAASDIDPTVALNIASANATVTLINASPVSDFDGDGKSDLAVWRPGPGVWYTISSNTGQATDRQWGTQLAPYGDIPVPGDYDGDGRTDLAVWRPILGFWFIIQSSTGQVRIEQWGTQAAPYNDIPVPADYDGDGKTDLAVWRPAEGNWFVISSSTGQVRIQAWGLQTAPYNDIPVPADYDGDGRADLAVWRPASGSWYVINSSTGAVRIQAWGLGIPPYNDIPVPADYDGDGKTDLAVWRPASGTWYIIGSGTGQATDRQWGTQLAPYYDLPTPADYDGDGRTDLAVWRPAEGKWYVINSSTGAVRIQAWGLGVPPYNDIPVPAT